MPHTFRYADLHCHPNLKTFGHSFDKNWQAKSDMWHTIAPTGFTRLVHRLTGITKFSQADFTTLTKAGAGIAFVSLYPFEKGFFTHKNIWPPLAAYLANWGIEIGYERVRYLQRHTDYFQDLENEYRFVLNSRRGNVVDGVDSKWVLTRNWSEVQQVLSQDNSIAVVLTIEGAHVFNTGLGEYGVPAVAEPVLANIKAVKAWDYVPLFIGLAHNFNNDLCGHARSLQRLGKLVNQELNIDAGISALGEQVIHALLSDSNGRRIYIDLKHMSLAARLAYYTLLETDYAAQQVPLIVSHGAVNGLSMNGAKRKTSCLNIFNTNDLNFFDEEVIAIARSGGLLAIQMDVGVNADLKKAAYYLQQHKAETPIRKSARIIWNQLQYIAELCDQHGLFGWGCTAVGSDFDGSIHPFPGVLTATGLQPLAQELTALAANFLSAGTLSVPENNTITPEEIVERFMYTNTEGFLKTFYRTSAIQKPSGIMA